MRAIVLLCAAIVCIGLLGPARAEFRLTILHINDLHSRIEAINRFDSTCSTEEAVRGECFGGFARIAAKVAERRAALASEGRHSLILDAGDQFQGSLFYIEYKGRDSAELMNAIGFDAMAVGNHEFDDGPQNLASFIEAVEFPVISGNTVVAAAETVLVGKIEPGVTVERGGEKIAILSVLATDTDETSSPGPNVSFLDEVAYLKQAVREVEAAGIDKIVLLSHVGFVRDREIAAAVDGIDVIVGGHSHTLMSNTVPGVPAYPFLVRNPSGRDVPIVQAYAYSKYLGELDVVFDDDGNVVSATGEPHLLDASVVPDPAMEARIAELSSPLLEIRNRVVGSTTAPLDGARNACRFGECIMGNLIADAILDRLSQQGVEIVITNGGGLRAAIDGGEVTMGEVLTVLPFQNTVATFRMTGKDIRASLEHGVSGLEEGAGRFPQVAGLRYVFDATAAPGGGRIATVDVVGADGETIPLDDDRIYTVATNNYLRGGGDGYALFVTNALDAYDYGPNLEDVVAEYLGRNSPYAPLIDGRVQLLQDISQRP